VYLVRVGYVFYVCHISDDHPEQGFLLFFPWITCLNSKYTKVIFLYLFFVKTTSDIHPLAYVISLLFLQDMLNKTIDIRK
jgi:hypothetical protein